VLHELCGGIGHPQARFPPSTRVLCEPTELID
jgi:hypothetical protein